ncbi:MAG: ATP-dependent helicase HrpA [Gammaproteobacteria bacterium]|jgi:ATP-dependent helicase HrpA
MSGHTQSLKKRILQQTAAKDRRKFLRQLYAAGKDTARLNALIEKVDQSIASCGLRKLNRPKSRLDENLPFFEYRDELTNLIQDHQVIVVCGETGSGKTTQLPQLCLDLGLADLGLIGHSQPRRIAATSVSSRIASELNCEATQAVGYKIRFRDRSHADGYIKIMTDGILLAEIQHDRLLSQYTTLIIDEAHERSLNIDLILGYIKQILPRRPDLKVIVTSATIDPDRFSNYFDKAPIVNISGRTYPVEIRYRNTDDEDRDELASLVDAIDELDHESRGDMLIFFPGERQIREAVEHLGKHLRDDNVILPLYSRLAHREQQLIFKPHRQRKIVLATNVAETSLTVPGIKYVIDTGLARMSRYSWRSRVQRLPIEKISQASANQRAGRCGRVSAGICIRLFSEEDFNNRTEFTEAEILRSNLASVILQMNELKLGAIQQFEFLDNPDSRLINDGFRLLFELKASDADEKILKHGRVIASLPVDPRLAHMLITSHQFGCLTEILIIVSALAVQDPRDHRPEVRQNILQSQAEWRNKTSDFMFWINLWKALEEQQKLLSRNQFSRWCRKHYLSYIRVREWQDTHRQIRDSIAQQKFNFNSTEADPEVIHRCIFNGIPGHIASLQADKEYLGTKGRKLKIFPGSELSRQSPAWLMAFAFIETSQLFAHSVARCNPQWAMQDAEHLHQYEYYEPHWQPKQGRVAALRNTRIYGLLIEAGKKINFASIDPIQSRQIFIQSALVEGQYFGRAKVIRRNQDLLSHYQYEEDKLRRRDLLIGEKQLYEFYEARLPAEAVDSVSFDAWFKKQDEQTQQQLQFLKTDILQTENIDRSKQDYPEQINKRGQTLNLNYHFDPADEFDGVTVDLPIELLNQFSDTDFDWLVPGLILERITALIRTLPRGVRKNFIPVKDFSEACLQRINPEKPLFDELTLALYQMTGVTIEIEHWKPRDLDRHLRMHYRIHQGDKLIAEGHFLNELQTDLGQKARQQFDQKVQNNNTISRTDLKDWDFEEHPTSVTIHRGKQKIITYPALVDYENSVAIECFETAEEAHFYHASGIARLFYFRLSESVRYLKKNLPEIDRSGMMYLSFGNQSDLVDDIFIASIFDCFMESVIPNTRSEFESSLSANEERYIETCQSCAELGYQSLLKMREVRKSASLSKLPSNHKNDIEYQIDNLIYSGFIRDCGVDQLRRIPIYLSAIEKRIGNYKTDSPVLESHLKILKTLWQEYLTLSENTRIELVKLKTLRWMIEELRITSFSQPMKTPKPVSETRIRRFIENL